MYAFLRAIIRICSHLKRKNNYILACRRKPTMNIQARCQFTKINAVYKVKMSDNDFFFFNLNILLRLHFDANCKTYFM